MDPFWKRGDTQEGRNDGAVGHPRRILSAWQGRLRKYIRQEGDYFEEETILFVPWNWNQLFMIPVSLLLGPFPYIYIYIYIERERETYFLLYGHKLSQIFRRCPWCNGYRRRKWTRRHEFKSWTRLIAFHIALMPLGKVWIQLFSLQLWVNSRAD